MKGDSGDDPGKRGDIESNVGGYERHDFKYSFSNLNWKRVLFLVLFLVLSISSWFLVFNYTECTSWECFNSHLESCDRADFIGGTDMIFEYVIKGGFGSDCEVGVQLLQGELNSRDSVKLEKQEMTCMLPKGVVMIPESDIGNCHGLLKEGLQDLVIKKLHTYLVQNLGNIDLEVLSVSGGG
ncbi:MAG: hypothetical protein OEL89_01695 [Candidatus Peregrinibacteria bacterium]|nr:hypothetical protein [Candidatus Peregrinibacteria bacterium]